MKKIGIAAAALAFTGLAAPAEAQSQVEREIVVAPMRAPRNAFELGVDLGYTQGFGAVRDGRTVRDIAGAGMAVGIGLGYRASPLFAIGANGQFQGFDPSSSLPQGTMVRGASAGLEATFHIAPFDRADPWVSLGAGYRMLWEIPEGSAPTTLTHGFELGRLAIGLDVRPSEAVALAPMLGVDLDSFAWQKTSGAANTSLTVTGVSAYLFAGIRGRFDVGGEREAKVVERIGVTATGSR